MFFLKKCGLLIPLDWVPPIIVRVYGGEIAPLNLTTAFAHFSA